MQTVIFGFVDTIGIFCIIICCSWTWYWNLDHQLTSNLKCSYFSFPNYMEQEVILVLTLVAVFSENYPWKILNFGFGEACLVAYFLTFYSKIQYQCPICWIQFHSNYTWFIFILFKRVISIFIAVIWMHQSPENLKINIQKCSNDGPNTLQKMYWF